MTDRPPIPGPAERARTIAARGPASLLPPLPGLPPVATDPRPDRVAPLLHYVHQDASVSVLLPDDHPLATGAPVITMVEMVDMAPVPLREPVRGLLWITGRIRALPEATARALAVDLAALRPDPRLLDLGHGATLCCLEPLSLVVADADGTHPLTPDEFAAAEADPFCDQEAGWLRHLEVSHTDVLHTLRRHLPDHLRGGHLRPLGLDRYGLRLRVEAIEGDHDVRLAFERPIATLEELSAELRRMVGCPFLAMRSAG
ncbi:DUF2470 domain-containing protein [Actinophytocola xanthii]|uniref:DUF2470 domain-containing protein n=1 Tax=Actinophytocola xanthii TaxID=1912961 RepID=A0A1Q8C8Q9_9PSEU|nr:DUF2470 domain-containing protein [Actinophytocola xanthii]OLF10741.1 DUF2470 domain-containing protein [Actinophytocola xanthii]